jgi:hypothetical protein
LCAGCQPRTPGEWAGVAEFAELLSANMAAEERTSVRPHLPVVAELEHQPGWLERRDGDADQSLGRMRFDSCGQRKISCIAVHSVHLSREMGLELFSSPMTDETHSLQAHALLRMLEEPASQPDRLAARKARPPYTEAVGVRAARSDLVKNIDPEYTV